jgi:hypothetical protein
MKTNNQGIKAPNKLCKMDIPMDETLSKLLSRSDVGKLYNPAAKYVKKRKLIVDWMF